MTPNLIFAGNVHQSLDLDTGLDQTLITSTYLIIKSTLGAGSANYDDGFLGGVLVIFCDLFVQFVNLKRHIIPIKSIPNAMNVETTLWQLQLPLEIVDPGLGDVVGHVNHRVLDEIGTNKVLKATLALLQLLAKLDRDGTLNCFKNRLSRIAHAIDCFRLKSEYILHPADYVVLDDVEDLALELVLHCGQTRLKHVAKLIVRRHLGQLQLGGDFFLG